MNTKVMTAIPFTIDRDWLFTHLHIKPGKPYVEDVENMIEQALTIGKPKAAYRLAYIESKGEDFVVVDGFKFTSRVLRVNLAETFKVVPYVITCGEELERWAKTFHHMFESYCADGIMEAVMHSARVAFFSQIAEEYNLGHAVNMNPGSLEDWPLKEQAPLFQLLGDVKSLIGVELKESFLMSPIKTVSGFRFSKEGSYENCQLCPREKCPGRRAPYEQNLYAEKYQLK
ncbi:hypothetical protein Dhaf_3800 [Desulfitobacterium hafniense DCB-2]|uniref:Uncharacterized protein n=1 Tax=Desulfitobacterium hafniense (strain DSM 10664 / DCB-2) TaxID=272564 RepID=B8FRQ6_DESHD|nr:vitamin B12 dependent-methionine synthase activation domain-containing protein [Desulfitobacterium hafniense]ACL21816.1 hypothetical protein Dhaf_3800 [Desulfitobacterium hafniense DCB-2]